jgi:hypothetical protein
VARAPHPEKNLVPLSVKSGYCDFSCTPLGGSLYNIQHRFELLRLSAGSAKIGMLAKTSQALPSMAGNMLRPARAAAI